MVRLLCAALGAAFLTFAAVLPVDAEEPADKSAAVFDLLRGGGNLLVMRHAHSPGGQKASVGMSEGCILQPGRGLDAVGLVQARSLGELLHEENVPILKAYTSDMCRAWDTARLTAGGAPVIPHPAQKTTDPEIIAAFKKEIEAELAANPGQNIILASHSNIAPLYGAIVLEGEEELPEGVINVVTAPDWNGINGVAMRIVANVEIVSRTVTVD